MIEPDVLQQTREAAAAVAAGWASHARLLGKPQVALSVVALDERGSETRNLLDLTRIHTSLLEGQRIILEGPAGCGKTTTLIQLAQICGDSQCVPLMVDLPGWITSGIDILEYISSRAAFLARDIDAATLARIALKEPCIFLINGLNEISDLHLQSAGLRLQGLLRDFPAAGVIVATRTQRFAPQLSASTRVRLLPLTMDQRFNYLEQALGTAQAHVLHSQLSGDRVLDGLTRTALFLAEITTIFQSGRELPRTKIGLLGAAVALIEHDQGIHLRNRPLQGRAEDYLRLLAIKLTTRGDVILREAEARTICRTVRDGLRNAGQIETVPDQAELLDALCAHHILETDYPGNNLRFQHQLFQEYYSALSLRVALAGAVATTNLDERTSFVQKYINEPAWEEPLLMIAEEIGAEGIDSASADKLGAGKLLVQATLRVDPILAGRFARLCGSSVWKEVRSELTERLRSLYGVLNRHYRQCALAGMLATGSNEFADVVIPLLTDPDEQIRLATYRAGPDFYPSSLGPEWQKIVAGWAEPSRIEFISELALHKARPEVALAFAREDPSPTVRLEAIRALAWVGRSGEVAELLQALPDKDLQQALQKLDVEDIPPPLRSRAISNYKSILGENTDPKARFQIALYLAELGDEDTATRLKDQLIGLPAAIVNKLNDHSLQPAIEIIRKVDPQWVSEWVADRIIEGWPDTWLSMVAGIPKSLREHLLQRVCTENLGLGNSGRIASLLAATADAALAKTIFGKLRDHRQGLTADPRNEEKLAINAQLRSLFKALSAPVAVEGLSDILKGEPGNDELSIIAEMFGDNGAERHDLGSLLPDHLRQQLRQYLKRAVPSVLVHDDLGGQSMAQLASALAEAGEPDDTVDLLRLINADIERVRNARASFEQSGRKTKAQGNIASYAGSYVQALVRLAQAQSESILIDLLREPEYEIDAAWGLHEIAKAQPSNNSMREGRSGWPQRDYRRVRSGPPEWSTIFDEGRRVRYAAAVTQRILKLLEESRSGDHKVVPYHHRLKELAKVITALDPKKSGDLILQIAALPGSRDGWLRVALLEGLLFGGGMLPIEAVMSIVDPVIQHLRTRGVYGNDASLLGNLLFILPFVHSPAHGVARIRELVSEFRLAVYGNRNLLIALGQCACDEGLSLLRDLAEQNSASFQHSAKDWIEAVAACPLPRARLLLLGFIDPEVGEDIGGLNLPDYAANFLASRLSDLARADESLVERILQLSRGLVLQEHRLVLTKIVTRLDTSQALIASLDLIDDESPQAVPYDLWRAIEGVFLEKRSQGEDSRSYRLVPRSGSDIKKRLLEMVEHDPRRARSAYDLLGQIEVWRLEYGRPSSEPRHPALESGKVWPPLPPDRGEAVGGENGHAGGGSEFISREERLQEFIVAHSGTTLADIKFSADVYTAEFQDWRKNRLGQESVMSGRIEDVLSGAAPLKKKPRKPPSD